MLCKSRWGDNQAGVGSDIWPNFFREVLGRQIGEQRRTERRMCSQIPSGWLHYKRKALCVIGFLLVFFSFLFIYFYFRGCGVWVSGGSGLHMRQEEDTRYPILTLSFEWTRSQAAGPKATVILLSPTVTVLEGYWYSHALISIFIFKFYFMCKSGLPACVCAPRVCLLPSEVRRKSWIP